MVRCLLVALLSVSCGFAFSFSGPFGSSTILAQDANAQPATETGGMAPKIGDPKDGIARKVEKQIPSEFLLPATTRAFVSIPDPETLKARFGATQYAKLIKDPAIKPFFDSFESQTKDWLNEQNVRLGLDVDDIQAVRSGEICIAGVLPKLDAKKAAKGSHGMVFLMDVSKSPKEAKALLVKINANLKKRGATQETKPINGSKVTVSTIVNKTRIRKEQKNYQVISNGWLLVSDNVTIFRDVLRRVNNQKAIIVEETLAKKRSFVTIQKRTQFEEYASQVRWYVDPFGYIQLARVLKEESSVTRKSENNYPNLLKNHGFDSFQGTGGNIAVATGDHEILHRTFTYAPKRPSVKHGMQIFEMFDFNTDNTSMTPANWVPDDCSAYLVGNWNFTKALNSIHPIYDAVIGEEGSFKRLLNDLRVDPTMNLDVQKLVAMFGNRIIVASAVATPITERSEHVVIGFPIKPGADEKYIFDSIKRASESGEEIKLGEKFSVIKIVAQKKEVDDGEEGPWLLENEADEEEEDEEEEGDDFQLFEQKFVAVAKGHVLVANNKDFLKRILYQKSSGLDKTPDYIQVYDSLDRLTDAKKVRWRQMGRVDRSLEANYELLRRGDMGKSQTVLARVINEIFSKETEEAAGKEKDSEVVRKQKLDGTKLPANYRKSVAPYLGPMGWALEVEDDGWRITGCVLKKKGMTEVVRKMGDEKGSSQKR